MISRLLTVNKIIVTIEIEKKVEKALKKSFQLNYYKLNFYIY